MPQLRWLHHIANGEKRDPGTARKLMAMGVRAGVWDIFWPCPRHGKAGVYMEFKKPGETDRVNYGLSKEQLQFARDLHPYYHFLVVDDWENAKDFVVAWLGDDEPAIPSIVAH